MAHAEEAGVGLSDQNLASSSKENPMVAGEISSEEDKIGASLTIERGTNVMGRRMAVLPKR